MPGAAYAHKILIVEDEPAMLDALVDNLQAAGFQRIAQASDGQAGLALALKEDFDLILLDIVLPKMDGWTVLKKIRASPTGAKVKIILLTNLTADASKGDGAADEPLWYLLKAEHSIGEVVAKVKEVLGLK